MDVLLIFRMRKPDYSLLMALLLIVAIFGMVFVSGCITTKESWKMGPNGLEKVTVYCLFGKCLEG